MVKRTCGVPPPPFPPAPPNPFRGAAPTSTARAAPAAVVEAQQPATSAVAHKAQAIPGVQWQCGPQASGFTAPQTDSQPAQAAPDVSGYVSEWAGGICTADEAMAGIAKLYGAQAAPAAVAGPHVTDAMALAFHSALSDGAIGSDEVEEIKAGLRAALAAAPTTQPAPQQEPDEISSYIAARAWVARAAQEGN